MKWELPEYLTYPILMNVAAVLLVASAMILIARRIFNHRLAQTENSEWRTGLIFLRSAVKATIFLGALLAIIYCIPPLRSLAVGFFAGASVIAAIAAFASQKAFANIVSGIFIVLFKPFRVDDIVKIQGEIGTVEDITLRHTVIRALENKRLVYPNSVIDSIAIINWTIRDEKVQKFMYLSVGFEADLEQVVTLIREETSKHPSLLDERTPEEIESGAPLVDVPILNFDNSMVNFRIPLWAKDLPTGMKMIWDLNRSLKELFEQAGIPMGRPSQVNYQGIDLVSENK